MPAWHRGGEQEQLPTGSTTVNGEEATADCRVEESRKMLSGLQEDCD